MTAHLLTVTRKQPDVRVHICNPLPGEVESESCQFKAHTKYKELGKVSMETKTGFWRELF